MTRVENERRAFLVISAVAVSMAHLRRREVVLPRVDFYVLVMVRAHFGSRFARYSPSMFAMRPVGKIVRASGSPQTARPVCFNEK